MNVSVARQGVEKQTKREPRLKDTTSLQAKVADTDIGEAKVS